MTDEEVVNELRSGSRRNQLRKIISYGMAGIDQATRQRRPISAVEYRRKELELAQKVMDFLGVK